MLCASCCGPSGVIREQPQAREAIAGELFLNRMIEDAESLDRMCAEQEQTGHGETRCLVRRILLAPGDGGLDRGSVP